MTGLIRLVSPMVLASAKATNGCGGSSSGTGAGNGGNPQWKFRRKGRQCRQ